MPEPRAGGRHPLRRAARAWRRAPPLPLPAPRRQVVGAGGIDDGEGMFQWLISPVDTETFYEAIHEVGAGPARTPLHVGAAGRTPPL